MNKLQLREKYPDFHYFGYEITKNEDYFTVTYNFEITNLITFNPKWRFATPQNFDVSNKTLQDLLFCLGLVESLSYLKSCLCKNLYLHDYYLTKTQIDWFKKLFYNGLGEYFYINDIYLTIDEFLSIIPLGKNKLEKHDNEVKQGNLVSVGGGKDSCVSLSLMEKAGEQTSAFVLTNDNEVTRDNAKYQTAISGKVKEIINPVRFLDKKII